MPLVGNSSRRPATASSQLGRAWSVGDRFKKACTFFLVRVSQVTDEGSQPEHQSRWLSLPAAAGQLTEEASRSAARVAASLFRGEGQPSGIVLVLAGPKGVGKSSVAATLSEGLGIDAIDPDLIALEFIGAGVQPDRAEGWLAQIRGAVIASLTDHALVSVEMTGAWETDYELCRQLEGLGYRVIRTWLIAPEEVTVSRLKERASERVPVTDAEARDLYRIGVGRAKAEKWNAVFDLTRGRDRADMVAAFASLLDAQSGSKDFRLVQ